MERTLAAFAASDAPLAERLRVAAELALAVAELHARGRVHGALCPERIAVAEDGGVLLEAGPGEDAPLARAGFDAPEVARGGRPTCRSDAFSLGALAWLALRGRGPFDAGEPLERVRRVLFAAPGPVRLRARGALDAETAIEAALDKRPRRRISAARLAEALGAAGRTAPAVATPTFGAPPPPRPSPPAGAGGGSAEVAATSTPTPAPTRATKTRRLVARTFSPLQRAGLGALPILALAFFCLPESDAALEREIASLVERGDLAGARRRLEVSAQERPDDPFLEKLRGDVACAGGKPTECIRRYRVALASRPELREDRVLRSNARRLVRRDQACTTRRSAAHLLGALRGPEALEDLEEARRSGGLLAYLCTGDSIERAITATRGEHGAAPP